MSTSEIPPTPAEALSERLLALYRELFDARSAHQQLRDTHNSVTQELINQLNITRQNGGTALEPDVRLAIGDLTIRQWRIDDQTKLTAEAVSAVSTRIERFIAPLALAGAHVTLKNTPTANTNADEFKVTGLIKDYDQACTYGFAMEIPKPRRFLPDSGLFSVARVLDESTGEQTALFSFVEPLPDGLHADEIIAASFPTEEPIAAGSDLPDFFLRSFKVK